MPAIEPGLFAVRGETPARPFTPEVEFEPASFLFGTGRRISRILSKISSGDSTEGAGEAIWSMVGG